MSGMICMERIFFIVDDEICKKGKCGDFLKPTYFHGSTVCTKNGQGTTRLDGHKGMTVTESDFRGLLLDDLHNFRASNNAIGHPGNTHHLTIRPNF